MKTGICNLKKNYNTYFGKKEIDNKRSLTKPAKISAILSAAILALSPQVKAETTQQNNNSVSTNAITLFNIYHQDAIEKEFSQNYAEAIEDYDKMIKLFPKKEILYQYRGELQYKNGNFQEAIRNYAIATSKYIHKKDSLMSELSKTSSSNEVDRLLDNIEAHDNIITQNMERIRTFRKIRKTGFDYTKVRDFDIEEVHQGQMRDCYLLATLCNNHDLIKKSNCLKWNKDGTADVFLYPVKLDNAKNDFYVTGKRKQYHISNKELSMIIFKLKKKDGTFVNFRLNPAQDITLKAIELGYIKNLNEDFISCNIGGSSVSIARMLFGSHIIPGVGKVISNQSGFDREDIKNGIFLVLPAQNGKYLSGENKPVEICGYQFVPNHTYIINGYDKTTDCVSLSNPYFDDRKAKKDDIIIPFDDIIKNHFRLDYIIPEK